MDKSLHDYLFVCLRRESLPLPRRDITLLPGCTVQYAWPVQRLVLEFAGGVGDCPADHRERDQQLMDAGYTVYRFTPRWLRSGDVLDLLKMRLASALKEAA